MDGRQREVGSDNRVGIANLPLGMEARVVGEDSPSAASAIIPRRIVVNEAEVALGRGHVVGSG